jgi:type I restriction enzyme, S subunit
MNKSWQIFAFEEAISDESGGNIKTPQSEFLPSGKLPIVDQGKALISGYINDSTRMCKAQLPVIIFGDHTRCFKFINFPFGMGADGIKVLRPRLNSVEKYLFHYLRSLQLPNAGYDRHFKYLKRTKIPLPPIAEQKRIAAILDKAEEIRSQRRQALEQLDAIAQSIFIEMFGDPVVNPKGWKSLRFQDVLSAPLRNGLSPSNSGKILSKVLTLSAITGHEFRDTAVKTSTFKSTPPSHQTVANIDFLICRGNGNIRLVGKAYFPNRSMADVVFPDTIIAAQVKQEFIDRAFLQNVWNSDAVRAQIESLARTTNGTFKVNQTMLEGISLLIPPIALQQEFAQRVNTIAQLKATHRKSLAQLDALFASLQHRAFRGEL